MRELTFSDDNQSQVWQQIKPSGFELHYKELQRTIIEQSTSIEDIGKKFLFIVDMLEKTISQILEGKKIPSQVPTVLKVYDTILDNFNPLIQKFYTEFQTSELSKVTCSLLIVKMSIIKQLKKILSLSPIDKETVPNVSTEIEEAKILPRRRTYNTVKNTYLMGFFSLTCMNMMYAINERNISPAIGRQELISITFLFYFLVTQTRRIVPAIYPGVLHSHHMAQINLLRQEERTLEATIARLQKDIPQHACEQTKFSS